jgi:hypothetical protein
MIGDFLKEGDKTYLFFFGARTKGFIRATSQNLPISNGTNIACSQLATFLAVFTSTAYCFINVYVTFAF